ncbi:MAG: helix-turn-helix transcriptional regulator, partial [Ferrovibrio sp.]
AQVIPEDLRPFVSSSPLTAASGRAPVQDALDMAQLRTCLRDQRKVVLDYADEFGVVTRRVIWPVTVGYFDTTRVICAWCELRQAFRHFRTDRVVAAEFLNERYPGARAQLWARWRRTVRDEPHPEAKA